MGIMLDVDLCWARGSFRLELKARVEQGVTGLFGPSGSGKSTLLSLLAGLQKPDLGRIVLEGETLVDRAARVWVPPHRRHIGLVFQDAQLFPHMSVQQNLLYGHARLAPELRRFELPEVVELLEIGHLLERKPLGLSGGERQRVALGRAILYSPRLLLLDEPLAALDERLKEQILPFLLKVRDETRIPMLYVSHSREEIRYLTGQVITLRAGRLET